MVSGAPDWIPDWLLLTPEEAAVIAAVALVLIIVLDVYASEDNVPNNTPRELVLRLAKWKSSRAYFPITGAFVPFGVATLVGHFFHPWSDSGPMGNDFPGLGAILAIAVLLSVVTWVFDRHIPGKKWVVGLALLGLVAGVVLWPVSV